MEIAQQARLVYVETMRIATLTMEGPLVLAPMAGVTDLPLRLLCRRQGAALVCSEMISCNGLVRDQKRTWDLLLSDPAERPLSIQLFGSDPMTLARAAEMVGRLPADVVDLNMGCSVRKILRTGAGSALMAEPRKARAIFRAMRAATTLPLTVKIRSGWDTSGEEALVIAQIAEEEGLDAIAVHPRTARQGFAGSADWEIIRRVREAVSVTVIGNGDVTTPEDAGRMLETTGCHGVMIGRAAMGDPWIFSRTRDYLAGREPREPSPAQREALALDYVDLAIARYGEKRGLPMLRSRLMWFVKGMPHAKAFRESIKLLGTRDEAREKIHDFFQKVAEEWADPPLPLDSISTD